MKIWYRYWEFIETIKILSITLNENTNTNTNNKIYNLEQKQLNY